MKSIYPIRSPAQIGEGRELWRRGWGAPGTERALSDSRMPPAVWTFLATPGPPFSLPSLSGLLKPLEGSRTFDCHASCKGESGPMCDVPLVPCVMFP